MTKTPGLSLERLSHIFSGRAAGTVVISPMDIHIFLSWRLTQGRIISNHSAPVYAGITGNVKVHLAFSSVYSMTNDGESRAGQAQSTDSNFVLGENVVNVDGEGGAETVVYEGAAPTGTQHVIRRQDGSKILSTRPTSCSSSRPT